MSNPIGIDLIARIATDLDKVTADDVGTVKKLLEQASNKPGVIDAIYLSARAVDALDLTPPQKAWLVYLQMKRNHVATLGAAALGSRSLGETFKVAIGSCADMYWLTDEKPITLKGPELDSGSDYYVKMLLEAGSTWTLKAGTSSTIYGLLGTANIYLDAKSVRLEIWGGNSAAFETLPTRLLETLRSALDEYLPERAQGELHELRKVGEQKDPTRRAIVDKIDAILAKRSEWLSTARALLKAGGAGKLAKEAINALAPMV
jgi:hypothetical protein